MSKQRLHRSVGMRVLLGALVLVIIGALAGANYLRTAAQGGVDPGEVSVQLRARSVTWLSKTGYDSAHLAVVGPGGVRFEKTFAADAPITFVLNGQEDGSYPDGAYTYELRLLPRTIVRDDAAANAGDAGSAGIVASGYFSIARGWIVSDRSVEVGDADALPSGSGNMPDLAPDVNDQVILDDLIVDGSACIGMDCVNGESFGFDTVRLKENNLRIRFDDTSSSASFPYNDWQLIANDSVNGGKNYFIIQDATANRNVFVVEAGARNNALYVSSAGRVGLGTATPLLNLHIAVGDTPAIRLDQDGSSGWTPQVWDVAGNEANFFIRDVTNGGKLPFRIKPAAPKDSLFVAADGDVGLGTDSPAANLHVELSSGDTTAMVAEMGAARIFELDANGNLEITGVLNEGSDRALKENFEAVDAEAVLEKIAKLPVTTWNYIADGIVIRHMGPMAQDFYAAFALGAGDTRIAPLDVNGVTLAGLQALIARTEAQGKRITQLEEESAALEAENAALEARLATLEAQVQALLAASEE